MDSGDTERVVAGTGGGGDLGREAVSCLDSFAAAGGQRALAFSVCTSGFSVTMEFVASGGGADRFWANLEATAKGKNDQAIRKGRYRRT